MIFVHHLNDSRSQRILWLLEELALPCEIKHYKRLETRLDAWVKRLHARPAYKTAPDKGGPYRFDK